MKYIASFLLKIGGWKIKGDFPTHLSKYVIIAAPHTHWVDFPLAVLVKFAKQLPVNYIGKKSLFKPPFGFIFRGLGGRPVDRSTNSNMVDTIINAFQTNDHFIFALSPEGTRKKVEEWKSGFYYIAKGANVPIVMTTLNFGDKEVKISEPYTLTHDKEADIAFMKAYFKGVKGKIPEYS